MDASADDAVNVSCLGEDRDIVIRPGLSVHVYQGVVGIYSDRMDSGRGFAELPSADFRALVEYFSRVGSLPRSIASPVLVDPDTHR
jgi:hypothetical protein